MLELSLILEVITLLLCGLLGHCFLSVVIAVLGLALLFIVVFLLLFLTLDLFAFLRLFQFDCLEIAYFLCLGWCKFLIRNGTFTSFFLIQCPLRKLPLSAIIFPLLTIQLNRICPFLPLHLTKQTFVRLLQFSPQPSLLLQFQIEILIWVNILLRVDILLV